MSLKRILKYFFATAGTILVLMLIGAQFMDRVLLPNGLYIYKTPFLPTTFAERNFYVYNSDDELIVDKPVEFICFNDSYLEGNTFESGGFFIYEIKTKKLVTYLQPEYFDVARKTGLSSPEYGCNGHFKYDIGTNLLWMRPQRLTNGPWE